MVNERKEIKKGLTDAQLVTKYDNGVKIDFDSALVKMAKSPSGVSQKKKYATKH